MPPKKSGLLSIGLISFSRTVSKIRLLSGQVLAPKATRPRSELPFENNSPKMKYFIGPQRELEFFQPGNHGLANKSSRHSKMFSLQIFVLAPRKGKMERGRVFCARCVRIKVHNRNTDEIKCDWCDEISHLHYRGVFYCWGCLSLRR